MSRLSNLSVHRMEKVVRPARAIDLDGRMVPFPDQTPILVDLSFHRYYYCISYYNNWIVHTPSLPHSLIATHLHAPSSPLTSTHPHRHAPPRTLIATHPQCHSQAAGRQPAGSRQPASKMSGHHRFTTIGCAFVSFLQAMMVKRA